MLHKIKMNTTSTSIAQLRTTQTEFNGRAFSLIYVIYLFLDDLPCSVNVQLATEKNVNTSIFAQVTGG